MSRLRIIGIASALWLAACGGDTISGTTSTTTTTAASTAAGISLLTSSAQIESDNSAPATITAYVRDANNNTLTGSTVTFSATSGLLAVTSATTDANGAATATLSAGADPTDRSITVTATTGTASGTVAVDVFDTVLQVTGPDSLAQPGSGTFTVILKNHSGGLAGQAVALTSANGNTLSASSVTTDATGQATFTVTAANGGNDTITAKALGTTGATPISVSTQSFAFTAPAANTNINLGVVVPVTLVWTNNGAAVAGQTIDFAVTRGTLSAGTAITDATGKATVSLSSTTSGPAVITASSGGVSTQVTVDFIATTAASIDVQASPSTVQINAQSTINAVVRDAANNLVEGKLVNFSLSDITGGTLSVASAMTNAQGVAQTIYTASSTTSATNGVSVKATVQGTAVNDTANLTVAGKTLFLSLGTGNQVDVPNEAQYAKTFAVTAIDGAGNAVTGITINMKVTAVQYYKGQLGFATPPGAWVYSGTIYSCASEDLNNNGILDPGEDFNNDTVLEPGTVAAASPGSVVTSATASSSLPAGSATLQVVYPKDHANWVEVTLTATATVAGTEASTTSTFVLPGLASDYTSQTVSPPGQISPYGTHSCAAAN